MLCYICLYYDQTVIGTNHLLEYEYRFKKRKTTLFWIRTRYIE